MLECGELQLMKEEKPEKIQYNIKIRIMCSFCTDISRLHSIKERFREESSQI